MSNDNNNSISYNNVLIADIVADVREKVKENPKYLHPYNKEFQEDMKRFGFVNGTYFTYWIRQNGIKTGKNWKGDQIYTCKSCKRMFFIKSGE